MGMVRGMGVVRLAPCVTFYLDQGVDDVVQERPNIQQHADDNR